MSPLICVLCFQALLSMKVELPANIDLLDMALLHDSEDLAQQGTTCFGFFPQVTVRVKVEEVTPEEMETPEALWESQSPQFTPEGESQDEEGQSKYRLSCAPADETQTLQETGNKPTVGLRGCLSH